MPKASKRRRVPAQQKNVPQKPTAQRENTTGGAAKPGVSNRPFFSPRVAGPQSLIWPGMVALGCWGMAFSFFVFSTDPNHMLFAGMAALLAMLWTFSVIVRVRKLRILRQKS